MSRMTGPVDPPVRRVGTAATFLESMHRSAGLLASLRGLRSRTVEDPAVALMDAWACALDVLTFYTERVAAEAYLRTATEARSLVELARAVGYERGPGRAAQTWLAFTLEDAPTAPPLVPVPAGTQVASRPGPGELPQTFETTAALDARPEWNAMHARAERPDPVQAGDTDAYLTGVVTSLRPGDWLLLAGRADSAQTGTWALRSLVGVTPLPERGVTRVQWATPLTAPLPDPQDVRVWALRLKVGLFGAAAPDWRTIPKEARDRFAAGGATQTSAQQQKEKEEEKKGLQGKVGADDWPGFTVVPSGAPANTVDLDGAHPEVLAGSWLVLQSRAAATGAPPAKLYRVTAAAQGARSDFAISGRTTRLALGGPADVATTFGKAVRATVALAQSEALELAGAPLTDPVQGATVELAGPVPPLAAGSVVAVTGARPRLRVAEGVLGLVLTKPTGGTVALHPGTEMVVTDPTTSVGDSTTWPVLLDDQPGTVLANAADVRVVRPRPGDGLHAEVALIAEPSPTGPTVSSLSLAGSLGGCYDRESLRISGNVAQASHGETKVEVLGSGDAAVAFQRFRLAQAPLTYVDGASSLVLRVDGIRWSQAPSLYGARPSDRVYAVRIADDGTVTLHTGDGVTGARLPTGFENVTATYRVGTGLAGVLPAGRLALLMTRPLGVRSVTNPLPTGLAADPDDPRALRRLAPRTAVATERVVSVTDFADFARATPGIAKATAELRWQHERPVVLVTVAGEGGQVVDAAARASLAAALAAAGAGHLSASVAQAEVETFDAALTLVVDPGRTPSTVRDAVRAELVTAFGFDARELGQPVAASEVVGVAQGVSGVVAVTLPHLGRTGSTTDRTVLLARAGSVTGAPAQLLLLAPAGLSLAVAT